MAASKRPRRSHLTSKFNSMTSITYVPMLLYPLNASSNSISRGGGGLPSIDLRGFAAGKNLIEYNWWVDIGYYPTAKHFLRKGEECQQWQWSHIRNRVFWIKVDFLYGTNCTAPCTISPFNVNDLGELRTGLRLTLWRMFRHCPNLSHGFFYCHSTYICTVRTLGGPTSPKQHPRIFRS